MQPVAHALLNLPDELLLHVALQCDDVVDVSRFTRTCTALHALITRTDHFWEQLLHAHYGSAHVCDAHASPCDHRALYREQCERLTWVWPTSSRGHLTYVDGDASSLQIAQPPGTCRSVHRAAYTAQPLPRTGLSIACVLVSGIGVDTGLIAYDGALDAEWDYHHAPESVLRMHVCTSSSELLFLQPATRAHDLGAYGAAAYTPAGMRAGVPTFSSDLELYERVYMAVDADRGRVYVAQGTPERWLVAFDDARLVQLGNLRVRVTLWGRALVRVERVRVTDKMRAALRALDAEYEAARGARAKE